MVRRHVALPPPVQDAARLVRLTARRRKAAHCMRPLPLEAALVECWLQPAIRRVCRQPGAARRPCVHGSVLCAAKHRASLIHQQHNARFTASAEVVSFNTFWLRPMLFLWPAHTLSGSGASRASRIRQGARNVCRHLTRRLVRPSDERRTTATLTARALRATCPTARSALGIAACTTLADPLLAQLVAGCPRRPGRCWCR